MKKRFIFPLHHFEWLHKSDETMDYLDLLHIVSVGVVHYNKYIGSSGDLRLTTYDVIDTIRQYTRQIFGGLFVETTGARNAIEHAMNDICDNDSICDVSTGKTENEQRWIALPMWVFKVHNAVLRKQETTTNHPLLSLLATRKDHFPQSAECSNCWIDHTRLRWDDDYVYKYLLLLYGPESTLAVGLRYEFFGMPWWDTIVAALQNRFLVVQRVLDT
jgi:hypothetical protein